MQKTVYSIRTKVVRVESQLIACWNEVSRAARFSKISKKKKLKTIRNFLPEQIFNFTRVGSENLIDSLPLDIHSVLSSELLILKPQFSNLDSQLSIPTLNSQLSTSNSQFSTLNYNFDFQQLTLNFQLPILNS